MSEQALARAVEALVAAKKAEEAAKAKRIEAEQEVLKWHPAKLEGSETIEAAGYKVTIKGSLNYKCPDLYALLDWVLDKGIPEDESPVQRKYYLDETKCKYLRANDPGAWREMSKWVTTESAKPNLSIKV